MLDADEYLHLAIKASQSGDHHASLEHLHKALKAAPEHTGARYFLAAEHAELGLYERACDELHELLTAAPEMAIARFQLGLLSLQLGRQANAQQAFMQLAESDQDPSLQDFAKAYLYLLDERVAEAVELLQKGLACCSNPALGADMSRVMNSLTASTATSEQNSEEAVQPIYLGAYRSAGEQP